MTEVIRVAVAGPFTDALDYRPPASGPAPVVGGRVRVPLGRRNTVGMVTALPAASDLADDRLRAVTEVLDSAPLLDSATSALIEWAARYYHHPLGEAYLAALPARLRRGQAATPGVETGWRITESGQAAQLERLRRRAPRQSALLEALQRGGTLTAIELAGFSGDARAALRRLVEQGLAETVTAPDYGLLQGLADESGATLNDEQQAGAAAIRPAAGHQAILIDGVTGSGKTEVYLDAIERTIALGRQTLVIVPEIGLTPQLVNRFQRRLSGRIAILHSGLADGERLNAWLAARAGEADVVIGTRSAVFVPLRYPGLIVIDEEHDASLKQQEGFRYSARDLAVLRGYRLDIPVVLGSATPSLESLANTLAGRYACYPLRQRAGGARPPSLQLLDMRGAPTRDGLSQPLIDRVRGHLDAGGQALLFLNRRGFAPTLICHECGWLAECDRCDARYTYHRGRQRLHCHHCDRELPIPRHCPGCGSVDLRALGLGTERIEAALTEAFPDTPPVRIDRDSTRRRGSFEEAMRRAREGETRLILGTQMLAKGHHLPAVTLVAIIDADQGLFGADFRAPERLAQQVIQVAGRAGRADRPGEVIIQTHHPEHPLLQQLLHGGYAAFARTALAEREAAGLPPARAMVLIRAEATAHDAPITFLQAAMQQAPVDADIERLGPYPAPMERRAGRHRAQLMLLADSRSSLQAFLGRWLPALTRLPQARQVRWSVDVDPVEAL
ncbi:primosomal protein N' [Spiribacter vilamensis]|uniref:Replication restart protein PriA n=1 Tax=Spiribacter vilamensis TaxID=531306 RepID=A0A4V2GJ83_9GAMM|nr:primosomal protein N' [Spiribacter vilamensis]RZU99295.1 replication restart DNA helicase PriA [Spiribacter vilamensis]TVO61721.1 primosomal protein N' [Spiribacter vilamensis]